MRDGKLVFIHIKIVCMFVFSCFDSRMFIAAAQGKNLIDCNKTSTVEKENPDNIIFPKISSQYNKSIRNY